MVIPLNQDLKHFQKQLNLKKFYKISFVKFWGHKLLRLTNKIELLNH